MVASFFPFLFFNVKSYIFLWLPLEENERKRKDLFILWACCQWHLGLFISMSQESETEQSPEHLCKINRRGSYLVLRIHNTSTTTKTWVTYSSSCLACEKLGCSLSERCSMHICLTFYAWFQSCLDIGKLLCVQLYITGFYQSPSREMKKKISKKIPCCSECDFTTGHVTCKSLQDINNSKVVKFTAFQDEQTVLCRLWWPSPASWQHQALRVCPQRRCTDDDLLNGLHTGPSHQGSQSHSEYKLTPGRTKVRSSLSGSQSAVWDLNIPVGTRNWTRFHIRTCLPLVYFLWFLTSDNTSTWLLLWLWFCHVSDFLFRVLLLHWCSVPHFYFWLIDTAIFIFGKRRFSLHPTTCQIVAKKKSTQNRLQIWGQLRLQWAKWEAALCTGKTTTTRGCFFFLMLGSQPPCNEQKATQRLCCTVL